MRFMTLIQQGIPFNTLSGSGRTIFNEDSYNSNGQFCSDLERLWLDETDWPGVTLSLDAVENAVIIKYNLLKPHNQTLQIISNLRRIVNTVTLSPPTNSSGKHFNCD